MNASRLRELIDFLLSTEEECGVQARLSDVQSQLENLAGAPQEPDRQKTLSDGLIRLGDSINKMVGEFQPTHLDLLTEIGAERYFTSVLLDSLTTSIRENPMTPAVANDHARNLVSERKEYLDHLDSLSNNLRMIGIELTELAIGEAELGFILPNALFEGHFVEFIDQQKVLLRIINIFSEATIGNTGEIRVKQLSSSDPLLILGTNTVVVAAIGAAVTWALDLWERVERIRQVRLQTKKLEIFEEDEVKMFDKKISDVVQQAVEKKTEELLAGSDTKEGRTTKERKSHLSWSLKQLLARIERGMRVEIRFLPPETVVTEDSETEQPETEIAPEFKQLSEIVPRLVFPKIEGEPLLELPPPNPEISNDQS